MYCCVNWQDTHLSRREQRGCKTLKPPVTVIGPASSTEKVDDDQSQSIRTVHSRNSSTTRQRTNTNSSNRCQVKTNISEASFQTPLWSNTAGPSGLDNKIIQHLRSAVYSIGLGRFQDCPLLSTPSSCGMSLEGWESKRCKSGQERHAVSNGMGHEPTSNYCTWSVASWSSMAWGCCIALCLPFCSKVNRILSESFLAIL